MLNSAMLKPLYSLLVPSGFFLLAAVLFLRLAAPESVSAVVLVYPYAVFAVGLLLGWRFNRSREMFAILVLALADRALLHFAAGEAPAAATSHLAFTTVAFLLPLNLAVFSLLTERGTLLRRGVVGLSLLGGQVLLIAGLDLFDPALGVALLEYKFFDLPLLDQTLMAQPALLAFALAFLLFPIRSLLQRKALDHVFLWALLAAFLALHASPRGPASTFYLATAGLILVASVIEASYRLAYVDELTGLPGRRALSEALQALGEQYAVAMVDVDHFKKFNDKFGHKAGDQVLRMVASKLEQVSGGGRAFRYGGEEFAVLFLDKEVEDALPHLEAVRETIESSRFILRGRERRRKKFGKFRRARPPRKRVSITVSIGVATPNSPTKTPEQVIQAADEALYRAKKAGRNKVKT
jgi:diguanylate cyclase (GGDEF)-like protein